jgi:hypothetical protein
MNRMIKTESSLFSLQMRCYYISIDYKGLEPPQGRQYIKDIFDD